MERKVQNIGNGIRVGECEPGNGTSYKVIAIPWQLDKSMARLGRVHDGWLVVNCLNGLSYLFQKEGYLSDDYIKDKVGGFPGDYPHLGDLVREVVKR